MASFRDRYFNIRDKENAQLSEAYKAFKAYEQVAPYLPGHPDYHMLPFGVTVPGQNAIFIIDIRGFTRICIAHDNEDAFKIIWAVTEATLGSIADYGGFVGEFTGDGVMAYFGREGANPDDAVLESLKAAAALIGDIKSTLAEDLEDELEATLRVGIGLETGEVLWGRVGSPAASDVKPISEVSFIAGKNSSHASYHPRSWQVLLGRNIAKAVPGEYLEDFEPYEFTYRGQKYNYERHLLRWQEFNRDFTRNEYAMESRMKDRLHPRIETIYRPQQDIREPKRFA